MAACREKTLPHDNWYFSNQHKEPGNKQNSECSMFLISGKMDLKKLAPQWKTSKGMILKHLLFSLYQLMFHPTTMKNSNSVQNLHSVLWFLPYYEIFALWGFKTPVKLQTVMKPSRCCCYHSSIINIFVIERILWNINVWELFYHSQNLYFNKTKYLSV